MTIDVRDQVRRYADHLESMVPEVVVDDVIWAGVHAEAPATAPPRWRPILVAAVAFAVVLVAIGSVALFVLGEDSEIIDAPPTPPNTGVLSGTWQVFSTESGLPAGPIYTTATDPSGAVWVAGDDGIYRFDGSSWHLVTALPEGIDPGIWLAVTGDQQIITRGHRDSDQTNHLVVFDGNDWRDLTAAGLVPANLGATVRRTLADGNVVVGAFGFEEGYPILVQVGADGLEVMVGDTAATSGAGGPSAHGARVITAEGVMWEGGIVDITVFDGAAVSLLEVPVDEVDGPCCIVPLAEDPTGGMWIQAGPSLYHYDTDWRLVATAAELPEILISSNADQMQEWAVLPTPDGGVWLVHTNGVGHWDGSTWTGYSRSDAESGGIPTGRYGRLASPVVANDGSVWTITSDTNDIPFPAETSKRSVMRIYRYVDSSWAASQVPASYPMSHINGILTITPDGSAWVATAEGVARFTPDS